MLSFFIVRSLRTLNLNIRTSKPNDVTVLMILRPTCWQAAEVSALSLSRADPTASSRLSLANERIHGGM